MEEMANSNKILVGKPERKGPVRRKRCRWEVKVKLPL
jgi:hypothetical protein